MSDTINEIQWQKDYLEGQNYSFRNLCDSCIYQIPECPSKADDERTRRIKYGDGTGRDNIRECYYLKRLELMDEYEIKLKEQEKINLENNRKAEFKLYLELKAKFEDI